MNNILITLKKELKLIIRDKKSLLMMAITPLFIPIFVILMSYIYEELTVNKDDKTYQIGVNYELSSTERELLSDEVKYAVYSSSKELKEAYNSNKILAYIVKDNNSYNIYANIQSEDGSIVTSLITNYLDNYNNYLGQSYLVNNNIDLSKVYNNLNYNVTEIKGESIFGNQIIIDVAFAVIAAMSFHEYSHAFKVSNKANPLTWLGYLACATIAFIHAFPKEYLISDEEQLRAYLRGVFLVSGSVNDPKTSRYHMEFILDTKEYANFINKLLNTYDLNSKIIKREKNYTVYIKEAEKISDFLRVIKVFSAVMYFEDIRIYRDHKNMTNRLNNCEQANMDKVFMTANKQINDIEKLYELDMVDLLDEKLKTVIEYRMKYKESSLKELAEIMSFETGTEITKSGLNHRFRKIREILDNIENK
mgnify:CR=1 FL=1